MKHLIFLLSFTALSQTPESRTITYDRLGEFAKAVEFKNQSDSIFKQYQFELNIKDSIVQNRNNTLDQYELNIVPGLERRIELKDSIINTNNQIFTIKEVGYKAEIKSQKAKKWYWLLGGVALGLLFGL